MQLMHDRVRPQPCPHDACHPHKPSVASPRTWAEATPPPAVPSVKPASVSSKWQRMQRVTSGVRYGTRSGRQVHSQPQPYRAALQPALRLVQQATSMESVTVDTLLRAADLQAQLAQPDKPGTLSQAFTLYERAVETDPRHVAALTGLAQFAQYVCPASIITIHSHSRVYTPAAAPS